MPGKIKKKNGKKPNPRVKDQATLGDGHKSVQGCDRYMTLFEESMDAMYITDRDGVIVDLNRAGCELLGYSGDDLIGQNVESTFVRKKDRKLIVKALETNNRIKDYELTLKKKDGTHVLCLVTSIVRRSQSGKTLGYQGIIRDITKSRQLELSLKAEFDRAEFYNDLMSHDINNFNQGALSNLELLLLSGELSEKGERYVRNAMDQITGSAALIFNMKKLQAIKSGELITEEVNALELLDDAIIRSRALFPGKQIDIQAIRKGGNAIVVGNRLLQEFFINLITNAIKFNRRKKPIIEIIVSNHVMGFLQMEFKDNGPGINDGMKKKIFDRSLRLHPDIWGTGLGLTLVKSIIESYGGSIHVKNRVKGDPSQGSNFILILRRSD